MKKLAKYYDVEQCIKDFEDFEDGSKDFVLEAGDGDCPAVCASIPVRLLQGLWAYGMTIGMGNMGSMGVNIRVLKVFLA